MSIMHIMQDKVFKAYALAAGLGLGAMGVHKVVSDHLYEKKQEAIQAVQNRTYSDADSIKAAYNIAELIGTNVDLGKVVLNQDVKTSQQMRENAEILGVAGEYDFVANNTGNKNGKIDNPDEFQEYGARVYEKLMFSPSPMSNKDVKVFYNYLGLKPESVVVQKSGADECNTCKAIESTMYKNPMYESFNPISYFLAKGARTLGHYHPPDVTIDLYSKNQ